MESGKYRVLTGLHVYNCMFGQLAMKDGVEFEVLENGRTARAGNILFSAELLNGCEKNIMKIER